jgi:competence protein ComEC
LKLPAFWTALFFIAGIWIGRTFQIPEILLFALAVAFFAGGLVVYLKNLERWSFLIIGCALFMGGIFRVGLDSANPPNNDISHFNNLGQKVMVAGQIISEPDLRPERTYLTVRADTLIYDSTAIPVSGKLLLIVRTPSTAYNYADYIRVGGFLSAPMPARNPGSFDFRKYLANKKIGSFISIKNSGDIFLVRHYPGNPFLKKVVIPLRTYILSTFRKYIDEPQRSLIAGFLIGETRFIPEQIYQNFRDTGTLHLLAVSGSNVALVIATIEFLLLFMRVPARLRHILSLFVIVLFSFLSYNQPSVVRASVMIGLYLVGRLSHRRVNYINILSVAAMIILMFEPLMLWDVGFQLSFAATFGLVYFLPIIYSRVSLKGSWKKKIPAFLLMTFLSSVVAQLAVAPILAVNFKTIPLIGFLSNLVVVPLASLSVVISLILAFVGWISPLGNLVGHIADPILMLTIKSVDYFAQMPVVKITMASPGWSMIILYYLIIIFGFQLIRNLKSLKYLILTSLVLANILIWNEAMAGFRDHSRLTVLDLGQAIGIHLKTRNQENFLFLDKVAVKNKGQLTGTISPYLIESNFPQALERMQDMPDSLPAGPLLFNDCEHVWSENRGQSHKLYGNAADSTGEKLILIRSNDESILGLVYVRDRCLVMILMSGKELSSLSKYFHDAIDRPPDLLIMPEPKFIDEKFILELLGILPEYLVFSAYGNLYYPPAGTEKLELLIRNENLKHFNTRLNGAIAVDISASGLSIKPILAAPGSVSN